ncbi:unnamed protein product [Soboliphyme baturini]|uniref:Uncharacterized protein n=1 Tax=Soboliphyme baturini TaxID=241478 RepID=A0A183J0S8_9BILA|nr:unnamed protein product [Soboliphyme baturini]
MTCHTLVSESLLSRLAGRLTHAGQMSDVSASFGIGCPWWHHCQTSRLRFDNFGASDRSKRVQSCRVSMHLFEYRVTSGKQQSEYYVKGERPQRLTAPSLLDRSVEAEVSGNGHNAEQSRRLHPQQIASIAM